MSQRLTTYALCSCALCLTSSTTVKDSLQIRPFMQNEPNFRKSQMNVSCYIRMDYNKRTLGERGNNEPKTNPNEPNFGAQQC